MKKSEFKEATKNLQLNDRVRAYINGYPFLNFVREGELTELTEETFTLHTNSYPAAFVHSYRRVISITKVSK